VDHENGQPDRVSVWTRRWYRTDTLTVNTSERATAATNGTFLGGLSEREVAVLRLVAQGRTNAEVAAELYISRRTVDSHMRRIHNRFGLDSRAEFVRFAVEHDLT
jgi:DNA-binding NarL/FixJ family response regulator